MKSWLGLVVCLWGLMAAGADSFYACVEPDPGASENPNYCKTPELAGTIADALSKCQAGDELVLLDGTYVADWANSGLEFDRPLTLRSYTGKRENCVLKGSDDGVPRRALHITSDGVCVKDLTFSRFFLNRDVDSTLVLRGGVIYGEGAGMVTHIENCAFLNNDCGIPGGTFSERGQFAEGIPQLGGGAIYYDLESTLHVKDCAFGTNRTCYAGGAVYCRKGTFADCEFYFNQVTNSTVSGWTLRSCGGGILSFSADRTREADPEYASGDHCCAASNCTFYANHCYNGWSSRGGGVYNVSTYRCTFNGNVAYQGRAFCGYQYGRSRTHVEDYYTDFWGADEPFVIRYEAGISLGGDYVVRSIIERCRSTAIATESIFVNCLFSRNGFVWMTSDTGPQFFNCTFAQNSNSRDGGFQPMDWNSGYFSEKCTVVNCLMVDNCLSSGAITTWNLGPPGTVGQPYMTNTVYQGHVHTNWNMNCNINFTNAPPTEYRFVGAGEHPYRLAKGSFGINYGTMAVPGLADIRDPIWGRDLLQKRRVSDGCVDVGCYEYQFKSGFAVRVR